MVQGALEWKNNGKQCSLTSVSACVCVCARYYRLFWLCMMQSFFACAGRFCVCVAARPVAVPVPVANLASATELVLPPVDGGTEWPRQPYVKVSNK